nr:MAG TPA: hypothetical protein [Caudoviricetes sp.]
MYKLLIYCEHFVNIIVLFLLSVLNIVHARTTIGVRACTIFSTDSKNRTIMFTKCSVTS